LSAIIHGIFLLVSVVLIPQLLNKIPLSVLAAVLFIVGYKLANPTTFKKMIALGWKQYVPYFITILGIVFTDLLVGIGMGLVVGIVIILIKSYQNSHFLHMEKSGETVMNVKMTLAEEVTFINKGAILNELNAIPDQTTLEIDVTRTRYLDNDIIEILEDFNEKAKLDGIKLILISESGTVENPDSFTTYLGPMRESA